MEGSSPLEVVCKRGPQAAVVGGWKVAGRDTVASSQSPKSGFSGITTCGWRWGNPPSCCALAISRRLGTTSAGKCHQRSLGRK